MASKSRGGLSKRELAAQKLKTSKPSSSAKTSNRATSSKSVAPLVGAGPLLPGQTRQAPLAGPSLPGKVAPGYYDHSTDSVNLTGYKTPSKSSSSGSSSSSKTSRAIAAKKVDFSPLKSDQPETSAPNPVLPAPKKTGMFSNLMGDIGKMFVNNGLNRATSTAYLTDQQRQSNINDSLGINSAAASGPSALELALQKGSTPDEPTGYGRNGEEYYNGYDPAGGRGSIFTSDFATPGTNFNRPGSEQSYISGESPVSYGQKKRDEQIAYGSQPSSSSPSFSPSPVRSPRRTASGSDNQVTAPVRSSVQAQDFQGAISYPDLTPVNNGGAGTRQRFLGRGNLSNGIASNGNLDSEFSGASFGAPTDGMDDNSLLAELRNILGVQTAQASEMPQNAGFQGDMGSLPMSSQTDPRAMNYQGSRTFNMNPTSQNEQMNDTRVQNPGGSQSGGVSQQFSQGATGGDPMDSYYNSQLKTQNKAFSAQEKAQKRALSELLKSITSQYKTQQTTGIDQLAKSKQEDLLKLSGLFQFANQDPDSEQRVQYEQRANQDYAGQQGDFLAKLAAAQAQEESRARQGYQSQMSDIAGQRNDARSKIEELIFNARQAAQNRGGGSTRALSGTAAGSSTYWGENAQGEPVYRNNQTGQLEVGTGLTRKSQDPYAQMLAGVMGQQQSGPRVQYDENGRPYIEQ